MPKGNTDWYILNIDPEQLRRVPPPMSLTIFDPAHYADGYEDAAAIQRRFAEWVRYTGEYVLNFRPERLALHETIAFLATRFQFADEAHFHAACREVYAHEVIPFLAPHAARFSERAQAIRASVAAAIAAFDAGEDMAGHDGLGARVASMHRILEERIAESAEDSPPHLIEALRARRRDILADVISETAIHQANKRDIGGLISGTAAGEGLLQRPEIVSRFMPLSLHDVETRKGFLVVGGTASGKAGVGRHLRQGLPNPDDILELNPDRYKALLLPVEDRGKHADLHAFLTHNESSIIFTDIAERWEAMANQGRAPHLLMDVARARRWMRHQVGAGGTHVEIHTPTLPAYEAIKRAHYRGEETGRYVAVETIIRSYADQFGTNLEAMNDGVPVTIYNNALPRQPGGVALPVAAHYDPSRAVLFIHDLPAMLEYFTYPTLDPQAMSKAGLRSGDMVSTVRSMLEYARHMDMEIRIDGRRQASLHHTADHRFHCTLHDGGGLREGIGEPTGNAFLQALKAEGVIFSGAETALDGERHVTALAAYEQQLRSLQRS